MRHPYSWIGVVVAWPGLAFAQAAAVPVPVELDRVQVTGTRTAERRATSPRRWASSNAATGATTDWARSCPNDWPRSPACSRAIARTTRRTTDLDPRLRRARHLRHPRRAPVPRRHAGDDAGRAGPGVAMSSSRSARRIEVLRGPFSVLYGNAAGGVIQVFTADGAMRVRCRRRRVGQAASRRASAQCTRRRRRASASSSGVAAFRTPMATATHPPRSATSAATGSCAWRCGAGAAHAASSNTLDSPHAQDPLGLDARAVRRRSATRPRRTPRRSTRASRVRQTPGRRGAGTQTRRRAARCACWRTRACAASNSTCRSRRRRRPIRSAAAASWTCIARYGGVDVRWSSRCDAGRRAVASGRSASRGMPAAAPARLREFRRRRRSACAVRCARDQVDRVDDFDPYARRHGSPAIAGR